MIPHNLGFSIINTETQGANRNYCYSGPNIARALQMVRVCLQEAHSHTIKLQRSPKRKGGPSLRNLHGLIQTMILMLKQLAHNQLSIVYAWSDITSIFCKRINKYFWLWRVNKLCHNYSTPLLWGVHRKHLIEKCVHVTV